MLQLLLLVIVAAGAAAASAAAVQVCRQAFAALPGAGQRTLYRDVHLAFDTRRALDDSGSILPNASPQLGICHHIFRSLYTSAAEPLSQGTPLKFHRSEVGDLSQDEDDVLGSWNPHRPMLELVSDFRAGEVSPGVAVREIPCVSRSDLY
jgi:hypothetical protein